MRKMILVDPKRCTGCRTCEMVCSFTNEQVFSNRKARIRNFRDLGGAFFASLTCLQCEDPPCAKVCPSGALTSDDGIVKVEASRCIGCKLCMLACPFGSIHFDLERGCSVKCELCDGDVPCVAYCPTGALRYQDVATAHMQKRETLFRKLKQIYSKSDVDG